MLSSCASGLLPSLPGTVMCAAAVLGVFACSYAANNAAPSSLAFLSPSALRAMTASSVRSIAPWRCERLRALLKSALCVHAPLRAV